MFCGLMSRCKRPQACTSASPPATCSTSRARAGVGPLLLRQRVQRPAGDVFLDQVDLVASGFHSVARRDEPAADPRQGAALIEDCLAPVGGGNSVIALEHDQALEGAVARQVRDGLAAFSELPQQLVAFG